MSVCSVPGVYVPAATQICRGEVCQATSCMLFAQSEASANSVTAFAQELPLPSPPLAFLLTNKMLLASGCRLGTKLSYAPASIVLNKTLGLPVISVASVLKLLSPAFISTLPLARYKPSSAVPQMPSIPIGSLLSTKGLVVSWVKPVPVKFSLKL